MTHTNHRRGSIDSLSRDFVIMGMASKGINIEGCGPKLQKFLDLARANGATNFGGSKMGTVFTTPIEEIYQRALGAYNVFANFNSIENAAKMIQDLTKADMGLSVVVSGLFDKVDECCAKAGIKRHTTEFSLGIWGDTGQLPEEKVLEVTTMCGHAMVSPTLVKRMVKDIQRGVRTVEESAIELAKPCLCAVFNPKRAEDLLRELVALEEEEYAIKNLISIDASKCDKCYACEVACLEAHPSHNQPLCIVDGSTGEGVSLHCLHCASAACLAACPTGNIYREPKYGVVAAHGNLCIGCKQCVMACPFGMMVWDEAKGVATKCDMCLERLDEGKAPACVDGCPTGSLTVPDAGGVSAAQRQNALATTMAAWDRQAEVPAYDYESHSVKRDAATAAKVQAAVEAAKRARIQH